MFLTTSHGETKPEAGLSSAPNPARDASNFWCYLRAFTKDIRDLEEWPSGLRHRF